IYFVSSLFLWLRPPPKSPLFPYTTLFRSRRRRGACAAPARRALFRRQRRHPVARRQGSRPCPPCRCVRSGADGRGAAVPAHQQRSEEHTSELQSRENLVCRLLLEKKKQGL